MPDDDEVMDLSVPPGHMELWTWGQVEIGHIVRDLKDRMHTVVGYDDHHVSLESARTHEVAVIPRPAGDKPVNIYVPSQQEALNLLHETLGAVFLRDIEDREHTLTRTLTWRLDPVPASAVSLRDHLDMIHGNTYVDIYLSRHDSAKTEAKAAGAAHDAARKKLANGKARANIKELQAIHDELHADPTRWPMSYPHHHAPLGGQT